MEIGREGQIYGQELEQDLADQTHDWTLLIDAHCRNSRVLQTAPRLQLWGSVVTGRVSGMEHRVKRIIR